MLLIIFSFLCFVVCCIGAYRVFKAVKANDTENINKWLGVTLTFMLASWIVRWISSLFEVSESDNLQSKIKYYFVNEDYVFLDGLTPKAYFKKGDVVAGFVKKYGKSQEDYLITFVAKFAIPITKLRYPTETELKEIEGGVQKLNDSLGK